MTTVRATSPRALRVILCLKFAHDAPFSEVAELKRALIENECILHSVEVSGSFDFMAEAEHSSLDSYQTMLDHFAAHFGHLVDHYEASFVCRRYLREEESAVRHFWVPTTAGMQRIEHSHIDKITAEGDYVRLHSGAASWLVHDTMKNILGQLDTDEFLRLSRSVIVRADFIDRLTHDYRRWNVRLFDGSAHPIAKSRSSRVIASLKTRSSMQNGDLPHLPKPTDESVRVMENLMH